MTTEHEIRQETEVNYGVSNDQGKSFVALDMQLYGVGFWMSHPLFSSHEAAAQFKLEADKHYDGLEIFKVETSIVVLSTSEDGKPMTLEDGENDEPSSQETNPHQHTYMMLSRLEGDCKYYLANGGRHVKHLWASTESEHIAEMKKLWNDLPVNAKPEWLSMEEIEQYEKQMLNP